MIGEHFPNVSPPSRQSLKSYNAKFVMDKCARNKYGATLIKLLCATGPDLPAYGNFLMVPRSTHIFKRVEKCFVRGTFLLLLTKCKRVYGGPVSLFVSFPQKQNGIVLNYILRKKKISTNESACKRKQRHDAFACVVFAGSDKLWSSLS